MKGQINYRRIAKRLVRRMVRRLPKLQKTIKLACLIMFACITLSFFLFSNCFAKNSSDEELHKYYTLIEIDCNDTLSDISGRYEELGYPSAKKLMKEICFINHISDPDVIISGQSIIIPYYSSELK